jgi:F420-non-reducing hydrogenase large subunit
MASRPSREQLEVIAGWGWEATSALEELTTKIAEKMADLEEIQAAVHLPFHSLALSNDGTHSLIGGTWTVLDPEGHEERRFHSEHYAEHLIEHVAGGSFMKSVRLRTDTGTEKSFIVGPLARLNVNGRISTARANDALGEFRSLGTPRLSALDFITARLIEMIHCAERLAEIAGEELGDGPISAPIQEVREGRFIGAIEAPRGILIHDYTTDTDARVSNLNLIVATQNNYDAIDGAITSLARHLMPQNNDQQLLNGVEFALRCFDPCLACATHMAGRMPMELQLRRRGTLVRRIVRGAKP